MNNRFLFFAIFMLCESNITHAQSVLSDSLFAIGVKLYNEGKYQKAIPIFTESDKLDKAELDSTSNRRDYSAMWLASCYYKIKEYDKARVLNPNFFSMPPIDRRLTVQSDQVAEKATKCFAERDYVKALNYYKECAELEKASLGDKNFFYANTMFNIYLNLRNMNDSVEIDNYYNQASKLYKELLGENNYVYYLITLYEGYRQLYITKHLDVKNLERIILFFLTSYKIAGDISWCYPTISRTEIQELAYILAFLYQKLGNEYNGDKRLILHTLSNSYLRDVELNNKDLDNIRSLYKISAYKYNFPYDIFDIIAIHKLHSDSTLRNDSFNIWKRYKYKYDVLCSRSNDVYNIGLKQFVTISESAFVECYPHIIERWLSYKNNGKNSYNNIVEDSLLPDSVFINAMSEKLNQNSYIDAWYLIEELHKACSTRNANYIQFYNSLWGYIWNMAYRRSNKEDIKYRYFVKFENADSCDYIMRALQNTWFDEEDLIAVHKHLGCQNFNYRLKILQRSVYNIMNDKYDMALKDATMILKGCITDYGDSYPLTAYAYKAVGICYYFLGDLINAETSFKKAMSVFFGLINYKSNSASIEYLNNSTMNHFRDSSGEVEIQEMGRTEYVNTASLLKAILRKKQEWQQVIDINKEIINIVRGGGDGPIYDSECEIPEIFQEMCMLSYWSRRNGYNKGKMEEYVSTFNRVCRKNLVNIFKREIALVRNSLYEEKDIRKPFSSDIMYNFVFDRVHYRHWFEEELPNICYWFPTDTILKDTFNAVLFSKGIILNTDIELKKLILESNDERLIRAYEELQEIHKEIQGTNKKQDVKELEGRAVEIENQLIQGCKEFGDYTKNMTIDWQQVQSKLSEHDMAIEFVSFPLTNDSTMYIAYVLRKDMVCPKMIPLFEEKLLKKGEGLYTNTSVSKLIWEPLAEYLEGVQNVYFAPAGELYNIGIEYLPHWSGEGIMSEKWNMYRLSSTRQLAVIKDKNALKQASIYGGVKYDTKEDLLVADSRKYRSRERTFDYEPFAIADSLNLRAGALYLPATKTEAEEIDKTLEQKKITTKLLIDTLATEGAFKNLSGKKTNLLHIATHGFYWTETEAKYKDNLSFLMLNDNQPRYVEDKALTRSGLLLAGANNALKGKKLPEGVDDGILTAKEISQLDLRGLDLVVLSACETGLGEIKGDGVFGLQRGFKKAGANSLLMSLWKVDDEATRLLMTQFYKNLTSGMNKFESLRDAQRFVREYEKEVEVGNDVNSELANIPELAQGNNSGKKTKKKIRPYQDPLFWAAFILLDAID